MGVSSSVSSRRIVSILSLGAAVLMACLCGAFFGQPEAEGQQSLYRTKILTNDLTRPWGLAFLPSGDALVTERDTGRILRVTPSGGVSRVQTIDEQGDGEGGLLGIALSPNYRQDKLVYIYYTAENDNRVARFRLGDKLNPILTGIPKNTNHNGGRIAFGPDGKLYIGTGDATGNKEGTENNPAQDKSSLAGKILKIKPDGSIPKSNPFNNKVYTLGHRNVQGLAWDARGRMYASEFGPNTFDEINNIRRGKNYGWPVVDGSGGDPRFVNPVTTFTTETASPSGLMIYKSNAIKPWQGDMFLAAQRGERIWKMELNKAGKVTDKTFFFKGKYGRIRHVAQGPDGSIWILTNNGSNDKVIRLIPN